jgi:ComF family protein
MIKHIFSSLFSYAGRCVVCQKPLCGNEKDICAVCLSQLPYTNLSDHSGNILERYFWGRVPIIRASSLFTYTQGARSHLILQRLKYKHQKSLGVTFGRIMAKQLLQTSFFKGIDMIVAVSLAPDRQGRRGYNQSEQLAIGIHEITGLPVITDGIIRKVSNRTQTKLMYEERHHNVADIFKIEKPERFHGRHILLVDDVVTSTATLTSLAMAFDGGRNTVFSVLTLAMAISITDVPYHPYEDNEDMENQEGEVFMPEN